MVEQKRRPEGTKTMLDESKWKRRPESEVLSAERSRKAVAYFTR